MSIPKMEIYIYIINLYSFEFNQEFSTIKFNSPSDSTSSSIVQGKKDDLLQKYYLVRSMLLAQLGQVDNKQLSRLES